MLKAEKLNATKIKVGTLTFDNRKDCFWENKPNSLIRPEMLNNLEEEFRRKSLEHYGISIELKNTNCKNCGAPLKSGKCEYCGSQYWGGTE